MDEQWRADERQIDGGYSGCEYPRLWPPRQPPYRVGNHNARNVYRAGLDRDTDEQVAVAFAPEFGRLIAAALNALVARRATLQDMENEQAVAETSLVEQNERRLLVATGEVPVADMPSFSIRMPQQLCDQVMGLAERDERTWSWMMRRLIEEAVQARGVTPYKLAGLHLT